MSNVLARCGIPLLLPLLGALTGACAYSAESSDEGDIASASQALWEVGRDRETDEWDSGMTNHLSAWQSISCYSDFGDDYLLTGLKVFQDSGSSDQYIARLVGECSGYSNHHGIFTRDSRQETEKIYASNHKTPGTWATIGHDEFVSGVTLTTDTWSDFVQQVRLEYVSETNPGILGSYNNPYATAAVGVDPGVIIGPQKHLRCPDQYVATAFDVKYDTTNGKVRRAKLTCRQLSDE
ncbi:MAG: hypothetical protein K0R38_4396 [Polyangiaceae bacterium]|jgi:hypothetical protein|nr:hypothetical protein [Polyangiaceae bacterium]